MEFINWKVIEEEKAQALIKSGYSSNYEGEAYQTISGQNANNSICVTDNFINDSRRIMKIGFYEIEQIRMVKKIKTSTAIFYAMAEAAWKCGDPGLMFGDTINNWNTCLNDEQIIATNPCNRANTLFLTPNGIKKLGNLNIGDTIWSEDKWVTITKKWSTGVKPVYRYRTTAGEFLGTEDHRIVQKGQKIKVKEAKTIDVLAGNFDINITINKDAVMDGVYLGDGYLKQDKYKIICVGKDDGDYYTYFDYDKWSMFDEREGINVDWRIDSNIENLPSTYERSIPDHYKFGTFSEIVSLLKGLFSANGCVHENYNRISLKTASKKMRDDIQLLLSAIGIKSYYTTNKEHPVKHYNGTYISKESYDINIGRLEDLERFAILIGFIQEYKNSKLENILAQERDYSKKQMTSIIKSIEYVGEEEVFDITVSGPSHTYWTNGCNVSNCFEYLGSRTQLAI